MLVAAELVGQEDADAIDYRLCIDAGAVALQPQPMAVVFDFMKPDRAAGDAG
jgi:hypothetical protein